MSESGLPWKPPVHRPAGARNAAEVKRELDRQRPSAARRGYDGRWRRARSPFLAEHPWCVRCLAQGRRVPATVVDHVEPHRGDERLFWDQDQWQVLCKPHHDAKTVRDGRWGQRHLSKGPLAAFTAATSMACRSTPTTPGTAAGGWVVAGGPADRDRAGRRLCMPAKFRRGVSGRFVAESLNSGPQKHVDSCPL